MTGVLRCTCYDMTTVPGFCPIHPGVAYADQGPVIADLRQQIAERDAKIARLITRIRESEAYKYFSVELERILGPRTNDTTE